MASISSYQTSGGTKYMVQYRTPEGRKTVKRGFKRKIDARRWAVEKESSKIHGEFVDESSGSVTIRERSVPWLAKKRMSVKPSTYRILETSLRVHVLPKWGPVQVRNIVRGSVQEWVTRLAGERSATIVIRAYGVLAGILDDAVADRLLARNPVRGVELPRKSRRKHVYLTEDQLFALARACRNTGGAMGEQRGLIVLMLGTCGMRWGEAVGLRVGDVDTGRHRILIERTATELGSEIVEGTPKNGKSRTIVYPDALDAGLKKLMEGKKDDDLLFTGADGSYLRRTNPNGRGKWFYRACETAGVPHMTIHDIRHTAASLMVRSGANVKAVQRQLGHSSAAMTLDVYADLFDDDLNGMRDAMNGILLQNVLKMYSQDVTTAS
ncbi:site-specific integrase [Bifidobacterium sp. ESL0790]|uniref:tyrosine-type recombinase/integrase n=1 Tax=Bifidobacterium sp. ESL0790 TaxID=2983233 RepID=UPI0023F9CAF3|nr:site-specific integrase [Bifidobacterium sp. ESL0790]WEV72112.1 tyrosine-type recombinase/integrase [Bifidobacterium sp. ESL0790]